jgi:hypothetical protein
MMMYTTKRTAKKIAIRIFQFYQIIACFMVRVVPTMSIERDDIVSVFFTRTSIFSYRYSSFCRS